MLLTRSKQNGARSHSRKSPTFHSCKTLCAINRTMRVILNFFLIYISLSSCSKGQNEIIVEFDNGYGLKEEQPVMIKEIKIGTIKEIRLSDEFLPQVVLNLENSVQLPLDSKFEISSVDLFTKCIAITPASRIKN